MRPCAQVRPLGNHRSLPHSDRCDVVAVHVSAKRAVSLNSQIPGSPYFYTGINRGVPRYLRSKKAQYKNSPAMKKGRSPLGHQQPSQFPCRPIQSVFQIECGANETLFLHKTVKLVSCHSRNPVQNTSSSSMLQNNFQQSLRRTAAVKPLRKALACSLGHFSVSNRIERKPALQVARGAVNRIIIDKPGGV